MTPFYFVLLALATLRISLMLTSEDGPMLAFKRLRDWAGIQNIDLPNGRTTIIVRNAENNLLGSILECLWCTSVWVSLIILLFYYGLPFITLVVVTWLSISMLSIILHTIIERIQEVE